MATRKSIEEKILELQAKIEELKSQDSSRHLETAKSFADAFMRKLDAEGISLKLGLRAYKELMAVSSGEEAPQRPPGSRTVKVEDKPYERGVVYVDPDSGTKWVGYAKGRKPPFVQHILDTKTGNDAKKAFYALVQVDLGVGNG